MNLKSSITTLTIVFVLWLCMAFECSKDNSENYSDEQTPVSYKERLSTPENRANDGFAKGHRLSGRWMNNDQGRKYFIFHLDGTFERKGASSGTSAGGSSEYVSENENSGFYTLNGQILTLELESGESEEARIKINPFTDVADYSEKTPTRLNITNGSYTGLYTNVGSE
jgi:hypothetical protein